MINNKGNREEREREIQLEKAIMYYYSTVTSEISNVIFTNLHSILAWMARNSFLKAGAISEV